MPPKYRTPEFVSAEALRPIAFTLGRWEIKENYTLKSCRNRQQKGSDTSSDLFHIDDFGRKELLYNISIKQGQERNQRE